MRKAAENDKHNRQATIRTLGMEIVLFGLLDIRVLNPEIQIDGKRKHFRKVEKETKTDRIIMG